MHIVNLMFSKGNGGIEQAFIDYCEGLQARGHTITAIIRPGAAVQETLQKLGVRTIQLRNFGQWDFWAIHRLRKQLAQLAPDILIAHANRAFTLASRAAPRLPLVGITHNYSTARLVNADAVFATTSHLSQHMLAQGVHVDRIFHIPNMVRCNELPRRAQRNQPPIIGAMGRFVHKKGFHTYIEALKLLRQQGYHFKAILGGVGEEADNLKKLTQDAGLSEIVSFPGWIVDKRDFYTHIDLFCLPSLHEPFGIVLLEAYANGAPVVTTDSEGPSDIATPNYDAVIVPKGDPLALAGALATLLDEPAIAEKLAANGFAKVRLRYSMESVSELIEQALTTILSRRQ